MLGIHKSKMYLVPVDRASDYRFMVKYDKDRDGWVILRKDSIGGVLFRAEAGSLANPRCFKTLESASSELKTNGVSEFLVRFA